MTNDKQIISMADSKERVAYDLYCHIYSRLHTEGTPDIETMLALYKECLMAVRIPGSKT